jgi:hypothetical protein
MSLEKEYEVAIQKLAGTYLKDIISIYPCEVISVDKENRQCDCTPIGSDSTTDLPGVLLCAENNNGLVVFPKVGSTVIVALSTRNYAFILMYSDLDSVQFMDGTYGGLVEVEPLVNKINALENLVNNILNVLKTTTIPLAPSGTYPFAPLYASLTDISPITDKSDIENTLVTHGKN